MTAINIKQILFHLIKLICFIQSESSFILIENIVKQFDLLSRKVNYNISAVHKESPVKDHILLVDILVLLKEIIY